MADSPSTIAADMMAAASAAGMQVTIRRDIVEVSTRFAAGTTGAYLSAERAARQILGMAPMIYPGSVWGSTSGSVGGAVALSSGTFRYCKSGVSKRVLAALVKAGAFDQRSRY